MNGNNKDYDFLDFLSELETATSGLEMSSEVSSDINLLDPSVLADELMADETENVVSITEDLHGNISLQSLELAKEIYNDWKSRERHENKLRDAQLKWVKYVLFFQMVAAAMLFVADFFWDVNVAILIGLISAIIVEFIGLLGVMVKYMYSERSTKSLEVVAQIMGEVGFNNSKYAKKQ